MGNVDAVLNEQNLPEFRRWLAKLTSLGYTNSYKVLNAKDYGVPQNRKRIFVVSMLGGRMLDFPKPCPDRRVLRDVLEEDVPEEYYLSEEKIAKYEKHKARHEAEGHGFGWRPNHGEDIAYTVNTKPDRANQNFIIESPICVGNIQCEGFNEMTSRVYDAGGLSPTIRTPSGGGVMPKIEVQDSTRYPCATAKGYMEAHEGDGLVMNRVLTARGTVQEASAPTLTMGNGCGTGVVVRDNDSIPDLQDGEVAAMLTPGRINKRQNDPRCKTDGSSFTITCQDIHGIASRESGRLRIRYLTPRECWRLMGFPDSAYEAARDVRHPRRSSTSRQVTASRFRASKRSSRPYTSIGPGMRGRHWRLSYEWCTSDRRRFHDPKPDPDLQMDLP